MVNEHSTILKLKVFPGEQPSEKNGGEKSLGSEFKLSRIPNSVTKTQIKIVP